MDAPLHPDPPAGVEDVSALYGPLKAACERAAWARFGEVAVVRPAYVCGPFDPEDSFTYWARRMADGGDIIVRDASAPMQIIDVRDLGAFLVRLCGHGGSRGVRRVGPFVATARLLAEIAPANVRFRLVEVDSASLAAAGVTLPMMLDDPSRRHHLEPPRKPSPELPDSSPRSAAETADATRRWTRNGGGRR
jgi:nucleoside-diphosphate-sugar epimerase